MRILVIGGTKYFGKRVVDKLLDAGDEVTLLTRGLTVDSFGARVKRLVVDRRDKETLRQITSGQSWDVILDQRCMNARDAQSSVEIFGSLPGHYVFTSSQSVYDLGQNIEECKFNPKDYSFSEIADESNNYKEAKRQAEAIFIRSNIKMSIVRPPIVLGLDDYTQRLDFHVLRVLRGGQIYFPNLEAKISLINSDDAADAIFKVCKSKTNIGLLNIASKDPVKLCDLMELISKAVDKAPNYTHQEDKESWSPYGVASNWYANVQKASSLGIKATNTQDWLPDLIFETVKKFRS